MDIKEINDALQKLDLVEPLINFEEEGVIKPLHYEALALMYANEGYRSYLKRQYNASLKAAALRASSDVDSVFGKAQALIYKKLLVDAKNAFEHTEKLRKFKENARQNPQGNE